MTTDHKAQATVDTGILCPRCDYDLRGMPRDARCPECGLRFNERSFLWEAPSMLRPVRGPLLALALVICGVQGYRLSVAGDPRAVTIQIVILVSLLLAFGIGLLPTWLGWRHVIAVSADGIIVRKPWRGTRYFPFEQIAEIRTPEHPTIPNIVVKLNAATHQLEQRVVNIRCHQYVRADVDKLVAICNASLQQWRSEQNLV